MADRVYFDTELRGPDLTVVGTMNYVLDLTTELLVLSYSLDNDPLVKLWVPDLSTRLHPEVWALVCRRTHHQGPMPRELVSAAADPNCYWVAWNAGFDRAVMTQLGPDYGLPAMGIGRFLDAQAQAQASNLPGSLDMAGRALDLGEKTIGGKAVMKRFADPSLPLIVAHRDDVTTTEERDHKLAQALELWDTYLVYAGQDTRLFKQIWDVTRPLDAQEWEEYWAHERINDRGMGVDVEFCKAAVRYKDEEEAWVIERCKELTDGAVQGPTFSAKITAWVYERLPEDLATVMIKAWKDVVDAEGNVIGKEPRLTLDKNTIKRLLEDVQWYEGAIDDNVIEFLELLEYGRSTSASKFQKMADQAVPDEDPDAPPRLTYSYTFNGAGQTGRFSSRGVQIHNLPNKALLNELDVMDMIMDGAPIERLRELPLDKEMKEKWAKTNKRTPTSVSAILGRLIRPAFIAPKKRVFVWCDWSAIEARVTPWLANTRDADEKVLDIFRRTDGDKNQPDIYVANAADIFNIPAEEMWAKYVAGDPQGKGWRQGGKIAVLSLGFLGGEGALKAMGRGYGMRFAGDEAKTIVEGWRARNKWARVFGDAAELAAFSAMNHPGQEYKAGKLAYAFFPDLMAGTLVCTLPCGRVLTYPMARIVTIEKFGKEQEAITYLRGNGRVSTWSGKFLENGTQAYAASLLRATLVRIEHEWEHWIRGGQAFLVGDTHDEIIVECDEDIADEVRASLHAIMVRGFDHSEGLPLAAEAEVDWYYHK